MKGFLNKIFARMHHKKSMAFFSAEGSFSPQNYRAFAIEGYRKNSITYRCVNMILRAAAKVPIKLVKMGRDGNFQEITKHVILDNLIKPNPFQSYREWMESICGFMLLDGNTYIKVDTEGKTHHLYPIYPDCVQIQMGQDGYPSHYIISPRDGIGRSGTTGGQNRVNIDRDTGDCDLIHIKDFDPLNLFHGMSPLSPGSRPVDIYNAQSKWNLGLLQNGGRPSGAVIVQKDILKGMTGSLTPEQREGFHEYMDKHSGPLNAGKLMLLEGGVDYKEMGLSTKEMDYAESRQLTAAEIAAIYGIPHQMLNIKGSQTFANYENARVSFYIDAVLPALEYVLGKINSHWVAKVAGERYLLVPDQDKLPALAPMRQQIWENVTNSQVLTTNEKRLALGYPKYKEGTDPGDQILVNSGLIPLGEISLDDPNADPNDFIDPPDDDE